MIEINGIGLGITILFAAVISYLLEQSEGKLQGYLFGILTIASFCLFLIGF